MTISVVMDFCSLQKVRLFRLHTIYPPTLNDHQSLLINSKTNISSLSILFDSCDEYMITHEVAKGIIDEVIAAVRGGVHNKQTRH